MLKCPNCNESLQKVNKSYKCKNNHAFDISKEGYLNLLLSKTNAGDNQEMIKARNSFLNNGYYNFLKERIENKINTLLNINSIILDAGCGSGFYLNNLTQKNIIGLDISKHAIKLAAKNNQNALFIVASANQIPLEDSSVDLILNIFSPFFKDEFNRVLKKDGYLLKVIPNSDHLIELKEILYSRVYKTAEKIIEEESLELISQENYSKKVIIHNNDLPNLLMMTPYQYKTSKEDLKKIEDIRNLEVTLDFKVLLYKKTF